MNCPYWQNAELHRVRKTKRPLSPRKANIKICHCTGAVKGGLNDSLVLVSSPEVACGFRYDPNHCAIPWDWGLILKQKKILSNPTSWVHLTRVNLPWWEFCPGWSGLRVGPPEWRDGRRWLPKTPLGWEQKNLLPQHRVLCHHRGSGAEHCRCPGTPRNLSLIFNLSNYFWWRMKKLMQSISEFDNFWSCGDINHY